VIDDAQAVGGGADPGVAALEDGDAQPGCPLQEGLPTKSANPSAKPWFAPPSGGRTSLEPPEDWAHATGASRACIAQFPL
jgi:hypothetical protein